jgi:hypothetical protein
MPRPKDLSSLGTISSRIQLNHRRPELFLRKIQERGDGGGRAFHVGIGDGALVFGQDGARGTGVERGGIQLRGSQG